MTGEEKEAIAELKSWREFIINNRDKVNKANDIEFYLRTALNLIQKQQEEIEKLRNKNQDLLRKLRNRVKEVKKLSKYSLYKKEFSRLNKLLEKKDKIIDEMAGYIATLDIEEDICSKTENEHCDKMNFGECEDCIKQYFESKV